MSVGAKQIKYNKIWQEYMIHLGYARKEQTQKQEKKNGFIVEDGITKNGWIITVQDVY